MSVFKVKLQNPPCQGYLDLDPTGANSQTNYLGAPFVVSKQRTMFCTGPNLIYRELFDGQVFTDCNYWLRYNVATNPCYGFIEVLFNDGSIFSDVSSENTFPTIYSPYSVLIADTFATNFIDIVGTLGGAAIFVEMTNNGTLATQDIQVQLNGSATAVMTLKAGDTQIFNSGDLKVTKLAFDGGTANTTLQIILSVNVVCNS
jgi:hypothetical protein